MNLNSNNLGSLKPAGLITVGLNLDGLGTLEPYPGGVQSGPCTQVIRSGYPLNSAAKDYVNQPRMNVDGVMFPADNVCLQRCNTGTFRQIVPVDGEPEHSYYMPGGVLTAVRFYKNCGARKTIEPESFEAAEYKNYANYASSLVRIINKEDDKPKQQQDREDKNPWRSMFGGTDAIKTRKRAPAKARSRLPTAGCSNA